MDMPHPAGHVRGLRIERDSGREPWQRSRGRRMKQNQQAGTASDLARELQQQRAC